MRMLELLKDYGHILLGLDLAGSSRRPTGYAYMKEGNMKVGLLYEDKDIMELARGFSYVFVDAPLSLPAGRKSLEDMGPHFRECDLMLRSLGHKFFPVTLGPMRKLTERGMRLARDLMLVGVEVVETFPGALYDSLGVRRKSKEDIRELYKRLGLKLEEREYSQDELDSVACWLSGLCYLAGKAQILSGKDGTIVVGSMECVRS